MLQRPRLLRRLFAVMAALALVAAACGDDDSDVSTDGEPADPGDLTITVGSKEFTEQQILGHMTLFVLEDAGYGVKDEVSLGGTPIVRTALEDGTIDMYWEYLGTGWGENLGNEEHIEDKDELYDALVEADAENGIAWLEPTDFNNTYAIATNQENADEYDLTSVSDVARLLEEDSDAFSFCSGEEFRTRDDGLPGVEATYDIEIPSGDISDLADALVYNEVADGSCVFGSVFATSGEIAFLDLVVLDDDKATWPPYYAALTVREEVLEASPELEELFAPLTAELDQETMTALNAEVDVEERDPEEVAETWLTDNGFLD